MNQPQEFYPNPHYTVQPPLPPLQLNEGWGEAVSRYIRWDIPHDVRGMAHMAARAGAIFRFIKTRGFVAAALTTEGFALVDPLPGDEVVNVGMIAVLGVTSVAGIVKHRNQIQKERKAAIAAYTSPIYR